MRVSPVVNISRRAFTLVELLVSTSVLAMLVLMYVGFFDSASRAWLAGAGNAERRRNARALTDYIGSELKGAMLPVQTVAGTSTGNLQFVINPSSGQVPASYCNADCIFWQAPLATESTYGDIAEVGYFVKWDETDAQNPRPMLCRFFVNPSTKDSTGAVSSNGNFLIYDSSPTKWLSSGLIDTVAPATKAKSYLGLFGENVIGLWIRSYGLDGQELPRSFDSRTGYACQFQTTDASGYKQSWTEQRYLPAKIVVSIAQVDDHYAQLLGNSGPILRSLVNATSTRDASQFLDSLRQQASGSTLLAPILPGIRIYSTEISLTNAQ